MQTNSVVTVTWRWPIAGHKAESSQQSLKLNTRGRKRMPPEGAAGERQGGLRAPSMFWAPVAGQCSQSKGSKQEPDQQGLLCSARAFVPLPSTATHTSVFRPGSDMMR